MGRWSGAVQIIHKRGKICTHQVYMTRWAKKSNTHTFSRANPVGNICHLKRFRSNPVRVHLRRCVEFAEQRHVGWLKWLMTDCALCSREKGSSDKDVHFMYTRRIFFIRFPLNRRGRHQETRKAHGDPIKIAITTCQIIRGAKNTIGSKSWCLLPP